MGLAQGHRAELGRRLRPEPRGSPHSPVELIVVIVDSPPEVEPGEREAEGADQEQEPQAFPLQEQSRAEGGVTSGCAPRAGDFLPSLPEASTARRRGSKDQTCPVSQSQVTGEWTARSRAGGLGGSCSLRSFCRLWRDAHRVLAPWLGAGS